MARPGRPYPPRSCPPQPVSYSTQATPSPQPPSRRDDTKVAPRFSVGSRSRTHSSPGGTAASRPPHRLTVQPRSQHSPDKYTQHTSQQGGGDNPPSSAAGHPAMEQRAESRRQPFPAPHRPFPQRPLPEMRRARLRRRHLPHLFLEPQQLLPNA